MIIENQDFCERLEYFNNIIVSNKSEAMKYVKDHRNIFATKIVRRSHIYDNIIVVSETSYYEDIRKDYWLWVFTPKGLYVVERPKYKIFDVVDIIRNCYINEVR